MAWAICTLTALVIGLFFRLYPLTHNTASDEYEQATMLVIGKVRAEISARINAQFPSMPSQEKDRLIQSSLNEVMHANSQKLRKAFDQVGLQLLRHSKEKKHSLQESDSYYFLDLTQNILEKGDVSSRVNGSRYFNEKMLAPLGYWEPQTWHPYIGAWVYRIAKFLNPSTDLMTGLGFTPLFLFPFVLAAFLLACFALGCEWPAAFTASIFFILSPIYLQRSTFAWYDNDTYSVLFPLLNLGLMFLALRATNNLKKILVWSTLAGLSFALFARFWTGWAFSWGLTIGTLALITARAFIFKEPRRRNTGILLVLTLATTLILLMAMVGVGQFFELFPFAIGELKKFLLPQLNGWPDLFIVVGELHATKPAQAIFLIGGPVVFLGALTAFTLSPWKALTGRKDTTDPLILLAAFTAVTFFLALRAERFTILLVAPISLAFASGLNMLWHWQETFTTRLPPRLVKRIFTGIFIAMTLLPVTITHQKIATYLHPIFNSAWDRALTLLREKSPPDSIVNAWWSPGHFIKAVAARRVTFDGASIKGEQAYWLTQVNLSQNEKTALGILRMLNTSSNKAAEFLEGRGWPLSRAVPLLTDICTLSRSEAAQHLKKILTPADARDLLKLTHGAPPPSYILIYNENVDGNVLLGYVGKWDFAKIERINKDPLALKQVPPKNAPAYVDFLWSLVNGPIRQSPPFSLVKKSGSTHLFEEGISIDTADMSVTVNSVKFGRGIPHSVVYLDEAKGYVVEHALPGANLGYAAVYFKDRNNAPHCALMERGLANSLLIKMYYFDGKGLENFRLFSKEEDLSGRTKIFIYEVKWPKYF